jgi:ketosteroid isomerase-like protein
MGTHTPEEVHAQSVQAANAGATGEAATGLAAVREVTQGLLALRPRFDLRVDRVLQSGDVAPLLSPWTMAGTAADGTPLTLPGTTTDVVRRQRDGNWRFAVDNPTGVAVVGDAAQS